MLLQQTTNQLSTLPPAKPIDQEFRLTTIWMASQALRLLVILEPNVSS